MPSNNQQIFVGTILGIALGSFLNSSGLESPFAKTTLYFADLIGNGIFLNLLKMVIIPLIFASIAVGIANLRGHAQIKKVWTLTLFYFFITTSLAIILGLATVHTFQPGKGLNLAMFSQNVDQSHLQESFTLAEFGKKFINGLFLNPFAAMAQGQILPTIIFAIFLGIALVLVGDRRGKGILNLLNELLELIMMMVQWIMKILPLGLMALLTLLTAQQDHHLLFAMSKFITVVIAATLFHGVVVLPLILFCITKITPWHFFYSFKEALLTAFSTSSSSATLPISIECVENNLKVNKDVSRFVLPLGATINMDGTALYEAIAAIFVANLAGIELNLTQQLIVFFTAMIASVGAPGIPSAGMVTMMMVLEAVGLPISAVAILIPIDRLLDTFRTAVNVEGDAIGSCIVHHFTK